MSELKEYAVNLDQVIIAARIGDFEVTNLEVYAWYGGEKVTKVPGGASFEIHAEYNIENFNPGLLLAALWTTTFTVWDVTHNKIPEGSVGYDSFGAHSGGGLLTAHDAVNCIMPNEPTSYRVKLFANQAAYAGAPPTTEW
ncbi:hypothetical protein ES703_114250 [subsurface metagenome]